MMTRRTLGLALTAAAFAGGAHAQGGVAMAIDEGLFVDVNGMPQWVAIRGRNPKNPVLLMLHGGPGIPISFMAPAFEAWTRDYTLVLWDQPGGGATHAKNAGREGPLTVERYIKDGLAVAEFARRRLGAEKLILMGNSWGSRLGVEMIRRRPELFAAYVGVAQVVSGPEGGLLGYQLGLEAARKRGDSAAVAALEKVGPPPYARLEDFVVRQTYTNPPGLPASARETAASAAFNKAMAATPPDAKWNAHGFGPGDFMQTFMATQRQVFAEAATWRARDAGLEFKAPVFVFQGDNDLNTPHALARDWVAEIRAPKKAFETIEGASHNTLAFTDEIHALLNKHVRPLVAAN